VLWGAVGATIVNAIVFFSSGVAIRWDQLGKGIVIAMLSALVIELIARFFGGGKRSPYD
jgi:drug/metabolite transporter (DMT)-like permease